MRTLKLGTHALAPTEAELVRMLLRLYGHNGKCKWAYAETSPYDALLVDASSLDTANVFQERMPAKHMLRLARGLDDADVLSRPLSAHKLRSWLDEVEESLSASAPVTPHAPELALAPAATPEPTPEPPREPPSLPPESAPRYRLERWPHQMILRKDPARIRMATLLSRRALNARDLVALTGFDPQRCLVFMQVLQASSLLTPAPPETAAHTAGGMRPHMLGKESASRTKTGLTQGLIAGLRKRLGL